MEEFVGVYWDEQGLYCFVKISAPTYEAALSKLGKHIKRLQKEGLFYAIGKEISGIDNIEII